MLRVFPKFGYFPEPQCIFVSCHSLLTPSACHRKEKSRPEVYPCCPSLGTSARSNFLVFPTHLLRRAWGCWGRMQKACISLLVPTNLLSPAVPNAFLQTLGFPPLPLLNSLGSCWQLWLVCVYLVCPRLAETHDLGQKSAGPLPVPPPLPFSLWMLSALNALSISRSSKPSQAILVFILPTPLFSCFSLNLITSLGKSLLFSALKPDKQWLNNSAIPLFLVYTFPRIIPVRKKHFSSVNGISHKPSGLFG